MMANCLLRTLFSGYQSANATGKKLARMDRYRYKPEFIRSYCEQNDCESSATSSSSKIRSCEVAGVFMLGGL